jgi:hypothetical protein
MNVPRLNRMRPQPTHRNGSFGGIDSVAIEIGSEYHGRTEATRGARTIVAAIADSVICIVSITLLVEATP